MNEPRLAFNGGEVTPYLRHRTDFEKNPTSAEEMSNFLPMPYGGVIKRPGLVSVAELVSAGQNSRLLPFIASTGDKYLLRFTPDLLTIHRTDGTVADSVDFMAGYTWPDAFEGSIRDLQLVQVNDVAFLTHPGTFPLRLSRITDSEFRLAFIPFKRAPMLDENTDKNKTYTVASNPVADTWADGEAYDADQVVFTNCEWKCTAGHTAATGNKPGTGTDWRDYWVRMFYNDGDPITLLADERSEVAWSEKYLSYAAGFIGYQPQVGTWVEGVDDAFICVDAHTQDETYVGAGFTSYIWLNYDTVPSGRTWVKIYEWSGGEGTSSGWTAGQLCYNDAVVYRCKLNHWDSSGMGAYDPALTEPGAGSGWNTYWEVLPSYGALPSPVPEIAVSATYQAGERVARKGRVYLCLLDHIPASANRPGSGASWETYWSEVSRLVEEFESSAFAPGQYFRISPERDEQDFQIEIAAIEANDGTRSEYIAVDGGWNFYTYGTWWGTYQLERSANAGKSWAVIRSWQSSGDRNVADAGFEETPVLLRLKFTKEDGGAAESGDAATSGKQRGLLIPESPYVTGYCLMDTYVSADEMTGFAKTDMLSGNTYRWAEGAFNSRDGFPRAICLHESRLAFAATQAKPVSLWLSASDDLNNFQTGVDADDSIYATLALTSASPIRWMASQRRLFVGTALGEWVVGSESSDAPVTPTNFVARQYSGYGTALTQPLIATDAVFFVERKGTRLRELAYSSERESYDAADLSRLAEHLTQAGMAGMAWQQTREPGLWVCRRDGVLLHFAYSRTERIMAWSQHHTEGGSFWDVCVLPSDSGDDEVFFAVGRGDVDTLERFPQHWQAAYEAGSGYTCSDTDDELAIVARLRSLPIEATDQGGTTQSRRKRLHKISLSLYQSAGGHVWNKSETRKQPITAASATLTSGWVDIVADAGHLDEVALNIIHSAPYPFILRAAVPKWAMQES